jgi:hypothetical protein
MTGLAAVLQAESCLWLYRVMSYARELGGTDDTYWLWLAYNRGAVAGAADPFEGRRDR